jgi:hypothetical protein
MSLATITLDQLAVARRITEDGLAVVPTWRDRNLGSGHPHPDAVR